MMRMLARPWREYKRFVAFIALMVLFRSAIADWNVVPSGSMLPAIREGDRILVDKMAYDLRIPLTQIAIAHLHEPQRGDVVTVDSSAAHELTVKRLIGLPGDTVAMRDNVLLCERRARELSAARARAAARRRDFARRLSD
jgi:signal peptidase I